MSTFIERRMTISFAQAAVAIASIVSFTTLIINYSASEFQSKKEAIETKSVLEKRIESVERDVGLIKMDLRDIAKDTNYIRGRLEPRGHGK